MSCEMQTAYPADAGILLLMKGESAIGKVVVFVVEFYF
jgi:hypothetical protein